MKVKSTSQPQMEMNNLLVPAKCASSCALIPDSSLFGQVSTNVNRHDVDERKHKHPDQVYKVPVQAADLDIFMFQFIYSKGDYKEVECAGSDVKHVETGNGKEGGAKEWRWRSSISERKNFNPMLG